ncbi:TRAP transporter small permease subunit [Candidatus Albibeggiatoa sp. nov. NOAA]|uniref:TRAP transporter small permease subunit n=1 Tax=Candidatus Albibeggiatoa sp. nov. NOAA TaxID=3162724 RepID=UPI0032F3FC4A|nr:TRAP transporter small permease subunit [Thiotrichaceae bacterium]
MKLLITSINTLNEWVGRVTAWLVLLMVLVIVYDVMMRRFFSIGSVQLQELQWHLFALTFLLGAAYTFKYDEHVRVDIFYQSRWVSDVGRAWINLLGNVFLLIPFCILIIYTSYPFVSASFFQMETSPDPGGLPYRFLLKSAIPLCFILLLLQSISNIATSILVITGYNSHPKYHGCCGLDVKPIEVDKG